VDHSLWLTMTRSERRFVPASLATENLEPRQLLSLSGVAPQPTVTHAIAATERLSGMQLLPCNELSFIRYRLCDQIPLVFPGMAARIGDHQYGVN